MTARTLKIKIKLGNGDTAPEANIDARQRTRRGPEPILRPVTGDAETGGTTRRRSASVSIPAKPLVNPRAALIAGALLLGVIGAAIFSFGDREDQATAPQTAAKAATSGAIGMDNVTEVNAGGPPATAVSAQPSTPMGTVTMATKTDAASSNPAGAKPDAKAPLAAVADPELPQTSTAATPMKSVATAPAGPAISQKPVAETPAVAQSQTASAAAPKQSEVGKTAREVLRSQLTSAMKNREPTDRLGSTITAEPEGRKRVFFFSELGNLKGRRITHRWEHENEVVANVAFTIGSDRWRVYSSKYLDPNRTGQWRVSIVDENGKTLHTTKFTFGETYAR